MKNLEKIILGIISAAILWLGATFFNFGQRITRLETQVELLAQTSAAAKNIKNSAIDTSTVKASVSIAEITDENGNEINKSSAPFVISVKGSVTDIKGKYVYLVVDDGNEWIEPGLGAITGKDFAGKCYLGEKISARSLNKWYKIYAVVTNASHDPYEHLRRETVIAQSAMIDMYRTH